MLFCWTTSDHSVTGDCRWDLENVCTIGSAHSSLPFTYKECSRRFQSVLLTTTQISAEHSGEEWRLGRVWRRQDRTHKLSCWDNVFFVYSTLTPVLALITKSSWIPLFFHIDILFSPLFSFISHPSHVGNISNAPTRSWGILQTTSCCILTWGHTDIIQRFYLGVGGRNSGECLLYSNWPGH